ncbi:MAG: hypothetical protein HGN29_08870 [Asgard group archaeon]|nr:hypothetical protein [Asgard group archaeon]
MKKIIKAAPDYLPLSILEFIRHFANLLTRKKYNLWINYDYYTKIIGYSCRSLFEVCMEYFHKDDLTIATSPLHHTSFRNIIERFVKPENIHIIKLNSNYNEIEKIPEMEKCDLVIITHLFGQDMDLSCLLEFKEKHNCIIIEDRVQGGTLDLEFSTDIVDISLYSMAMDKRPVALGGGFMNIINKREKLIEDAKKRIETLPREKRRKRFFDLLKKIPTYIIYNSRTFLFIVMNIIRFLSVFSRRISLLKITISYRTKNPGFSHFDYMLKPSNALLKSMFKKFENYEKMEKLYREKFTLFFNCFSPNIISYFFPWIKDYACLTPYNTILIEEHLVDQFLEFLNNDFVFCIPKPTYKVFNFSYENDSIDKKFNIGIIYLPSLANMKLKEIKYLSSKVKEFYDTIYSEKEKKK